MDYDFTYTGAEIQAILDTGKKLKDSGYIFLGVATPSTNPGTPTQKVYYEAKQAGTYTNFGGAVLPDGISLLIWNGSWTSETVMCGDGGVFDISVYKSSGGTLATFADLAAALDGGNNIPASARKGGMSVKFVQSSDNKYVQARCMAQNFTTDVTQWQIVTDEISFNDKNIPYSSAVEKAFWIGEPDTIINMSDYTELEFCITAEDKWAPSINFKSKLVPVLGGKRYIIKNINSREWYYAFLTSDSHTSGSDASYATGCGRVVLGVGEEKNILAPIDANYLFVTTYLTPDVINPVIKIFNKHDLRKDVLDIHLQDSTQDSDFEITDENYYSILRLKNGHIQTKDFDSKDVEGICLQDSANESNYEITDENYNSILKLSGGHIFTKNFNSEDTVNSVTELLNDKKATLKKYTVRFSDFKNQENTDDDAIADMLSFSSIFDERVLIIDENIIISKAILLPSNTTVVVDGVTIKQADYSFDNVFRGANVPWNYAGNDEDDFITAHDKTSWTSFLAELPASITPLQNIKIIGKNGAKIIGNNINATIHYIYGDTTQSLVGDFYGIRTHQIDFSYVDNIEVSGFELSKTRGWAISFDICKNIEIHDMVINSNVKTGDGIDFRYGCKNVKCYNISGSIYDDVVACTCLPDMNAEQHDINGKYMFASQASRNIYYSQETLQDLYIENVSVQNVLYKGSHADGHGLICLSSFGGKVQNISIDNVEELPDGVAKESVVKIYTSYGTGYTSGDLNKIRVNEVKCVSSTYAFVCNCICDDIWLNKLSSDTSLTNISYMQGFKITNSNS